jgi:hypothetical protein
MTEPKMLSFRVVLQGRIAAQSDIIPVTGEGIREWDDHFADQRDGFTR